MNNAQKLLDQIIIIIVFAIIILGFANVKAENYAVLISAGKLTKVNAEGNSEYWYDLVLMYEMLYEAGWEDDKIHVLYAEGTDYPSTVYTYYRIPLKGWPGITSITDRSNSRANIEDVFDDLSQVMTDEDVLFVFWGGHGEHHDAGPDSIRFWIENRDTYVYDYELASWADQITHYKKRYFSMITCYSEAFFDDISNNKTVCVAAADKQDFASSIKRDVWHREGSYHMFCANNWETPTTGTPIPIDADYDDSGMVSADEEFDYAVDSAVYDWPEFDDPGGISDNTYLFCKGDFVRDTNILDDIDFTGSVCVLDGVTLTIQPGVTIRFDGYYSLFSREGGDIQAIGKSDSLITFTSVHGTSRKSWKNTFVYSSDNTFKHCKFEYGNWALLIDPYPSSSATNNVVENCTFYQNDQAIRVHENSTNSIVKSCSLHYNRHAFVLYNNPYLELEGNLVEYNDRDGIYSWNYNELNLYGNVFQYNGQGSSSTRNGIYSSNDDVVELDEYNTVRYNEQEEIYANYGTDEVDIYYSSIHDDNDTGDYELYNYSSNNAITADYCWWGLNDACSYSGPVTLTNPQDDIPTWDGDTETRGTGKPMASPPGNDKQNIADLKSVIRSRPNSPEALEAFKELYLIIRKDMRYDELGEKDQFYGFMAEVYTGRSETAIGKVALQKMIGWQSLLGNKEEAIALSHEALNVLSGDARSNVLAGLAMLYASVTDVPNAKSVLNTCKADKSMEPSIIQFIEEYLTNVEEQIEEGIIEPYSVGKPFSEPAADDESTPEQFGLSQNFPNPGNPTTSIQFSLPESGHVMLKITNLMGQEVKTLVDENRQAGSYSVVWDGKDSNGVEMPSGIYIYTLHVGEKVFTKKLTLMK